MKKVILGAVASAFVVFIWGFISHMLLPIGEIGFKLMGNEQPVINALKENVKESGIYFLPEFDYKNNKSKKAEAEWTKKYKEGPNAFIVYSPKGQAPMTPMTFFWELLVSFLGGFLASYIVLKSKAEHFWCRVGTVTFMGIFAWVTISVPYWNWYHFPLDFTLAQGVDEIGGWFLAGLAIAKIVKPDLEQI